MVDQPAGEKDGEKGPVPAIITREHVLEANPRRGLPYDKSGDMHYDVISAFIKSMRGSDPDAVLYWLARMLDAGEDPKFIARRIMICASEDVGNADPQALLVAHAAFRATEVIGMPECRINLAQAATYLALAPKSNAAEAGIDAALEEVRRGPAPRGAQPPARSSPSRLGRVRTLPLPPTTTRAAGSISATCPRGLERGSFYHPSGRGWEAWRMDAIGRDVAEAAAEAREGGTGVAGPASGNGARPVG